MAQLAGHCDIRGAQRLTTTIFAVRVVLIGLTAIGTGFVVVSSDGDVVPTVAVYCGLVSALGIYVTFGWLEQVLVLLIGIAFNTAQGSQADGARATENEPAKTSALTSKPSHWSDRQERAYQQLMGDSAGQDEPSPQGSVDSKPEPTT